LAQTVTTFFTTTFLIVNEQKMSAHKNILMSTFLKMSTSGLGNCHKYYLNVDEKMVSKMKQINVNARKHLCCQLFFKLSASENNCHQLFCQRDERKRNDYFGHMCIRKIS
jgi:hypothetical protein